jgi:hypothetical protein
VRKPQDDVCLTETSVRKQSLKELAQRVIDRHSIDGETDPFAEREFDLAPLSPSQQAARREVLDQLAAHPNIKRAFVNRFESDGTMILTLAIRGVGTGELLIPAERFDQASLDDYGALLKCFEGAA